MSTKSRFTTTDVKAMVRDTRFLLGYRLANVYDVSDKMYQFKFASQGNEKVVLILESGIRFHTTKYSRSNDDQPSPFTMKLRKHIRTKKLEGVSQLGEDRVVDFKFGSGDSVNHIILELYANGNIVLTDANYQVIALLRSHQFSEDVTLRVDEIYPVVFSTNISASANDTVMKMSGEAFKSWVQQKVNTSIADKQADKKSKAITLKQILLSKDSGVSFFGPDIIDHCIMKSCGKVNIKAEHFLKLEDKTVQQLLLDLQDGFQIMNELDTPGQIGYIITQIREVKVNSNNSNLGAIDNIADVAATTKETAVEYVEFVPKLLKQHENKSCLEFSSFNEAVDEYYGKIEDQKLQRSAYQAEETARKKIEKVKEEHEKMVLGLTNQQNKMQQSANLLEFYAEDVDKCLLVLNSALQSGMTWENIEEMVETEQENGNPIAMLVSKLRLERNHVILKLQNIYAEESDDNKNESDSDVNDSSSDSEHDSDNDNDDENNNSKSNAKKDKQNKDKFLEIEIDLALSAHANACNMYSHKKTAKEKESRVITASEKVIQNVEEQTMKALEKQKIKRNLQAARKVYWFEKFNWFITSEGYLVLSGRDAQQNEALYKKYMRAGDIYVHADLAGASSCIIRAKNNEVPTDTKGGSLQSLISPLAIQEAGIMAVCRSSAWQAKVVTSAWWVWSSQVSKTAPTGEYLTTGSFMIYGKKNFLPPMSLDMGFGIMFRLDDSSVFRHINDHKDRVVFSDVESMSIITDNFDRYSMDLTGLNITTEDGGDDDEDDDDNDDNNDDGQTAANTQNNAALASTTNTAEQPEGPTTQTSATATTKDFSLSDEIKQIPSKEKQQKQERQQKQAQNKKNDKDNNDSKSKQKQQQQNSGKDKGSAVSNKNNKEDNNKKTQIVKDSNKLSKEVKFNEETNKTKPNNDKEDDDNTQESDNILSNTPNTAATSSSAANNSNKSNKKIKDRKKARRYAEQDDDDRELAMLALGHKSNKDGEKLIDKQIRNEKENKQKDLKQRQEKVGIKYLREDWTQLMSLLSSELVTIFNEMIQEGIIKEGEIDSYEIKGLASFPTINGKEILNLFRDSKNIRKINNKSGFLAGIMRRYAKDMVKSSSTIVGSEEIISSGGSNNNNSSNNNVANTNQVDDDTNKIQHNDPASDDNNNNNNNVDSTEASAATTNDATKATISTESSRRSQKKQEKKEILEIMQEEGIIDEEIGQQADDLLKITGCPLSEDKLLFAIPVCGPYVSLQNFKYKVKLTPGTLKKGKAVRQAIELFTRANITSSSAGGIASKEEERIAQEERNLIKGLTDPELVAIMIGDVKLSMPGLYSMQKKKNTKTHRRGTYAR